jgi:surface-anchored protein
MGSRPLKLLSVACLACGLLPPAATASTFTLGHGDIGVAYPGTGSSFEMEVHVGQGGFVDGNEITDPAGQAYEPGDIAIQVPEAANLRRIDNPTGFWAGTTDGYNFTGANYNALGVAVGADLWVLSFDGADADHYGTPFLGWATEEGFVGEGFSSVTFTPTSFTSPTGGNMGVYTSTGTRQWALLHGDTDFTGDSFAVPANGHAHRVLFFTEPGLYEVGIRATATHPTAGIVTGEAVYSFQVVPEPSSMMLAGCGVLALVGIGLRRRMARTAG